MIYVCVCVYLHEYVAQGGAQSYHKQGMRDPGHAQQKLLTLISEIFPTGAYYTMLPNPILLM